MMTMCDLGKQTRQWTLVGMGLLASLAAAGCQVHQGGQTLPSPHYMDDDVQYFAPGPEFKLAREAAALKAAAKEDAARRRVRGMAQ